MASTMDIFTGLATTCIKVASSIFKKPLERRLAPERRTARYLLRLYGSLRDCHDSYSEWRSTLEQLRNFDSYGEWRKSCLDEWKKTVRNLESLGLSDNREEEENRASGADFLVATGGDMDEAKREELNRIVEEEINTRIAWGDSIRQLHLTLREGRTFLEIHNEELADELFRYSHNEDDGFEDADLDLESSDLAKKVATSDFEHARSMLAKFVKKHTKREDFF